MTAISAYLYIYILYPPTRTEGPMNCQMKYIVSPTWIGEAHRKIMKVIASLTLSASTTIRLRIFPVEFSFLLAADSFNDFL